MSVRWRGRDHRVAVVNGASAGVGYETAKHLALSGMTVVGCARNMYRGGALAVYLATLIYLAIPKL